MSFRLSILPLVCTFVLSASLAGAQERDRGQGQAAPGQPEPAKAPEPPAPPAAPQIGLNAGGGGFYIKGDKYMLRLLGYGQAVYSVLDGALEKPADHLDFSIRRARLDFMADFVDRYQIFVEIDAAPGARTALVEMRLNWKIRGDALQLRFGKFTSPFSTENFRSSRAIDTVERYMALDSMFLLPALDTQTGAMVHGKLGPKKRLGYFLGIFNGNGSANQNVADNNGTKEVQARLMYQFGDKLEAGVSFDTTREEKQTLSLVDLNFNPYLSVDVEGRRTGVEADLYYKHARWSVRAEALRMQFETLERGDAVLTGGFVQPGYWFRGDDKGGTQGFLRGEISSLDIDEEDPEQGDALTALTAGVNWFPDPNIRVQLNGILHRFNGPSTLRKFDGEKTVPLLLTEVQFKF